MRVIGKPQCYMYSRVLPTSCMFRSGYIKWKSVLYFLTGIYTFYMYHDQLLWHTSACIVSHLSVCDKRQLPVIFCWLCFVALLRKSSACCLSGCFSDAWFPKLLVQQNSRRSIQQKGIHSSKPRDLHAWCSYVHAVKDKLVKFLVLENCLSQFG